MTPAQHLDEAERLLAQASDPASGNVTDQDWVILERALVHAIIAAAAELGVPHDITTTGGAPGATPPQAT